ncbi:E3 ubiquitin-protein ligase Zswim2-like [Zootermopsis nevadensis]|uniref:E3 ubiquitin-protein ligase Zswim2-like n=1 Tax=Zootermopsis nevadensis TaxID=136037 RepID=UPI000B8E7491|nr:E3 ubiquitin-protein ligase Zswim2-like [Zootermopsis nevadensis]
MARKNGWRLVCPEPVRARQLLSLSGGSRLFLIRQNGPAAYTIKEEGLRWPLQVLLGDPHSCTCRFYRQERELCLHICWTLLRKLQLKVDDPLSYQTGLVPHELNELILGTHVGPTRVQKKIVHVMESVPPKPVGPKDMCPICLEDLLESRRPVTFCRYGCGQSVHIVCMRVLALHRVTPGDGVMLSCPLCRGDFSTWRDLLLEMKNAPDRHRRRLLLPPLAQGRRPLHEGVRCTSCQCSPLRGPLYRCLSCPFVLMCEECVTDRRRISVAAFHRDHGLAVKESPLDRWRASPQKSTLPRGVPRRSLGLSKETTHRVFRGQDLLNRGQQCCLCLAPYQIREEIRTLPCGHQFHAACVSRWLLHSPDSCPLDGAPVVRAHRRACGFEETEFGNCKMQRRKLVEPQLQQKSLGTGLQVKGLTLSDRRGAYCLYHQGDNRKDLCNVGKLLSDDTAQQPGRRPSQDLHRREDLRFYLCCN